RVLSARQRAAREDAGPLGLAAGEPVYEIIRVRLAGGQPVALERTVLVADAFPGLLEEQLEGSLYEVMRARFGEAPVRAVERLEAAPADRNEADALGIRAGEPVLCVERTAYLASGRAVERGRDAFRADRTRVTWASKISA
nr:UTRA domain-containing protein [Actinomycetota bacterium]